MVATLVPPDAADAERSFWTYWTASATSGLGSAVTAVALPLAAVLLLHASTFQMGLLGAASYIAWLVIGLPAGALVRQMRLRRTQVLLDLVRAVAVASIPIAWLVHVLTLGQLIGVALVISFADVVFSVANSTFLPNVVPAEKLHERNSLMSGTEAVNQLGGPSLGGVLVQLLGAAGAMWFDAVSYVVSAALLRRLREAPATLTERAEPLRQQIREGWDFVTGHAVMNACMWAATVFNFVNGAQLALFAAYLVRDASAPAGVVGVLIASSGVGALLGAAVSPSVVGRIGSATACVGAALVAAVGALIIPIGSHSTAIVTFVLGNVVFASAEVILSTAIRTFRQTATPRELLSRVMATVRFVSWGAIPIGSLVAGTAGQWIGIRATLFGFGAVMVLVPTILMISPVRRMRDLA